MTKDLKESVIRGGFAKVCSQAVSLSLRVGSLMVLARLLDPRDFGLVGMVAAFTGVLNLFRDFGLSSATVQRRDVTDQQISTLFWINVLVGAVLALLLMAMSPLVVRFYHEPHLVVSTIISISMAVAGFGYWALVTAAVSLPFVTTICLWRTTG